MKNLIFVLVVALSCSQAVNAQTNIYDADSTLLYELIQKNTHKNCEFFQKLNTGMTFGSFATTNFKETDKPFDLGFNLFANVNLLTKKTFHNLQYGFGNNSLGLNQGIFLPKDFDVYFLNAKSLSVKSYYSALGVEKLLNLGADGSCLILCEIGTDYQGHTTGTIGVIMLFQKEIWKRK